MYIEQDCSIEFKGKRFVSGGAVVNEDQLIAYIGKPVRDSETTENYKYPKYYITNWHGDHIGTCLFRGWTRPFGQYYMPKVYTVLIMLKTGDVYKGKTQGAGMVVKAKRYIRKGIKVTVNMLD